MKRPESGPSLHADTARLIEARLQDHLEPLELEVVDESWKHAGHEGARSGGGHFQVRVVSPRFSGKSPIERHRMVFKCLEGEMRAKIHALSLVARAPGE